MKKIKFALVLILIVIILIKIVEGVFLKLINKNSNLLEYTWSGDKLIGHAFGGVNGDTYTNSLEAFESMYSKGLRTMEVDFQLTSDNKIVLSHDYKTSFNNKIPTEEEFLNTKIYDKYTPLSFEDLVKLMQEYPDLYIVTDSKYTDKKNIIVEFTEMLNVIKKLNVEELIDRFIIQIYNEKMFDYIEDVYPFNNIIFTLYARWDGKSLNDFYKICKWCKKNNIKNITMWNSLYNEQIREILQKYELKVYLHTENNIKNVNKFLANGVAGVYTDFITPDDIE